MASLDEAIELLIEACSIAIYERAVKRSQSDRPHNIDNTDLILFRVFLKCYRFCETSELKRLYNPVPSSNRGGLYLFPTRWYWNDQIRRGDLSRALDALKKDWQIRLYESRPGNVIEFPYHRAIGMR
jgi:hypothetical protein